jgi:hypothetical protein
MVSPRLVAKIESEEPTLRLAVLIDADNSQAAVIEGLLAEIARFGEATVKRIYGDFTAPTSASWKKVLQRYAIKPIQQFAYTTGKNATDSTLIIDAMDLLYTRKFDGFCLITSDSDFTGLAMRLREEGLTVLGFGEKKTPEAFRNACHKFVFTEVLRPGSAVKPVNLPSKIGNDKTESCVSACEVVFNLTLNSDALQNIYGQAKTFQIRQFLRTEEKHEPCGHKKNQRSGSVGPVCSERSKVGLLPPVSLEHRYQGSLSPQANLPCRTGKPRQQTICLWCFPDVSIQIPDKKAEICCYSVF